MITWSDRRREMRSLDRRNCQDEPRVRHLAGSVLSTIRLKSAQQPLRNSSGLGGPLNRVRWRPFRRHSCYGRSGIPTRICGQRTSYPNARQPAARPRTFAFAPSLLYQM